MWALTLTIDLIEEDEVVRESTRELLETFGYEVREYPTAEAFLGHSHKDSTCLLVDHHLPGMTGLELLEHLRARGKAVPAVLMTGLHEQMLEPRVAQVGAKLLHKPTGGDELVATVRRVTRAHR